MGEIFPAPLFISGSAEYLGIISISSQGFCGEDDFGCPGEKAPSIGEEGRVFFC